MVIGKQKITPGVYRVVINGCPSRLYVERGGAGRKQWGGPEMWWVKREGEHGYLFERPGLAEALWAIRQICLAAGEK